MVVIYIHCPQCGTVLEAHIDRSKLVNERGLSAISLVDHNFCPHSFVAYVDNNLAVRDCYLLDFQVQIPEIEVNTENSSPIDTLEGFDVGLIKLSVLPKIIVSVIRAVLFKQNIILLTEKEVLIRQITKFFEYLFNKSFEADLTVKTSETYAREKVLRNRIILDRSNIIEDKNKLTCAKMKIERKFIFDFFNEDDSIKSSIYLKNNLQKGYLFSKSIVRFIKKNKSSKTPSLEKINQTEIIEHLWMKYKVRIGRDYLDWLMEIVENYFGIEVPTICKSLADYL